MAVKVNMMLLMDDIDGVVSPMMRPFVDLRPTVRTPQVSATKNVGTKK